MATKKRVVRRRAPKPPEAPHPAEESASPAPRAPQLPDEWTSEIERSCPCGELTVVWEGVLVSIHGPGRLHRNQFATCGKCKGSLRVAPIVAWAGRKTNEYYTLRDFVPEGGDRKV